MANTLDIYLEDCPEQAPAIEELASFYNCSVIANDGVYVTLEGADEDLDNIAEFWNRRAM